METYDIVIIGAGVIGCAIARECVNQFPERSVAVIEKERGPGLGTSSKNSGVLHSGFHQAVGSLKARFAKDGHILARDFSREKGVPMLDSGMLIAAPYSEMLHPSLWCEGIASLCNLLKRGKKSGASFEMVTPYGIKKLEPHVKAPFGVFIPSVCVVDSEKYVQALANNAKEKGASFFYENEIRNIWFEGKYTHIVTENISIKALVCINCAGLSADRIANMALREEKYVQYFWSGEYYEIINPEKIKFISRLVYPVVSPRHPGKGVHIGPRPDGSLFLGPNARYLPSKNFKDSQRSSPEEFLKVINSFGLRIEQEDVRWAHVGIRPKLSSSPKDDDFHIGIDSHSPLFINNIGIDSPGISASMALAKYVMNFHSLRNVLL